MQQQEGGLTWIVRSDGDIGVCGAVGEAGAGALLWKSAEGHGKACVEGGKERSKVASTCIIDNEMVIGERSQCRWQMRGYGLTLEDVRVGGE